MQSNKPESENKKNNMLTRKNITKVMIPNVLSWVFYYAFVILFGTWWFVFEDNHILTQNNSLLHIGILVASAVFVLILKKEYAEKILKIAPAVLVLLVVAGYIFDLYQLWYYTAISGIVIGLINICIIFPFGLVMNNTERFFSVVGSNILIYFFLLLFNIVAIKSLDKIIYIIMLLISVVLFLFFKKPDYEAKKSLIVNMPRAVYWILVFCVLLTIAAKGVCKAFLEIAFLKTDYDFQILYYIGGLAGCFLYLLIFKYFKKCVIMSVNICFGLGSLSFFCYAFGSSFFPMYIAFAILSGIASSIGIMNTYYIFGVIINKYSSLIYLKIGIITIGIFGGGGGVLIGNLISFKNSFAVSLAYATVSFVLLLLLLVAAPQFINKLGKDSWAFDAERIQVNISQTNFDKYLLSKREKEILTLLLQGLTLRQISGTLGISYSTVNTFYNSIYKKCEVNSRIELILLFKKETDK